MSKHDVVIVGAGPAGLAAAAELQAAGLDVVLLEKGSIAQGIVRWPLNLKFFSTSANVELSNYPLITRDEKPTREEYLNYLRRFVQEKRLVIESGHDVRSIARTDDGGFVLTGETMHGELFRREARYVVIAIGAGEFPKALGVPGEDRPHVSHYFVDVHPYAFKRVVVVGGKSSATEAALMLWRNFAQVTLVHRGAKLEGLKYWIQPDIENRIANGEIAAHFESRVLEIRAHEVDIAGPGGVTTVSADFVLALTGYDPDVEFLKRAGVTVALGTNTPTHDEETLETNVPGIYVAGVVASGNISGQIFIENSRHHGQLILAGIRRKENAAGEILR